MDREKFLIEAANLATIEGHMLDKVFVESVLWMIPKYKRMPMLESFLKRDDLSIDDQAWAHEHRLIVMASVRNEFKFQEFVEAHLAFMDWVSEHLPAEQKAIAFSNSSVWGWWLNRVGMTSSIKWTHASPLFRRLRTTNRSVCFSRATSQCLSPTGRIRRNLHTTRTSAKILRKSRDLPLYGGLAHRLSSAFYKITSLMSAKGDRERAGVVAAQIVDWIRGLDDSKELIGEVAAQCMFQEQYDLAEQYGDEALQKGQAEKNPYIYVWHAGGHLGATGDVEKHGTLMKEARRHISSQDMERFLTEQKPFSNYKNDPRLRAIAKMRA